jgi:amino acid transporter
VSAARVPEESTVERLKRVLVGRPIPSRLAHHERLSRVTGLAVLSSDALSSVAYATDFILVTLVAAGGGALVHAIPISAVIATLLGIVAFSYRQTIHAYPTGGGAYIVAKENIGANAGLIAAASLLVDYTLTVSVSISAGVLAITSAAPQLHTYRVELCLLFLALLTIGNLRGIRESGTIFALPTYLFIVSLSVMLIVGVFKAVTGTLHPATPPPVLQAAEPISLWLILRAFSAGAVAMSGTEAISNGVPVFQKPESKNAATTLTVMATLLGLFFLGVSYLATHMGLVPGEETIISQVAVAVFGTSIFYYIFQIATTGILVIAGNTAFADFPRLSSVLARDNYMPHQFSFRGDRLSFSTGIIALGTIAALLVVAFGGNVDSLIHLYAVGVFLAFTMSDSGMVVHWWRTRGPGWKKSILINGTDAVFTSSILVIVAITKFALGAWIVIVLIPINVFFFLFVHRHYNRVAQQLRIMPDQLPSTKINQIVLVPIDDVNYASLRAMAYARTIAQQVVVIHVATNAERTEKVREKMARYAADLKFVVIDSPYRAFTRPLLAYVDAVHQQCSDAFVSIVLPEFIPAHWWEGFLHNRTARTLRQAFERHPNVALVLVPYLLDS